MSRVENIWCGYVLNKKQKNYLLWLVKLEFKKFKYERVSPRS